MDIQEILASVRDKLDQENIPRENRDYISDLLEELLTSVQHHINFALHPDALESLANALVNNSDLLAIIQRQGDEMDALKRITVNLTASLELDTVLDAVTREAMRLVSNALDVHIFLYHNEKLSFGTALFSNGKKDSPFSEPRPKGMTYDVAKARKIIIIEDMQKETKYGKNPPEWTGSMIGIPLLMSDRVVGVMNLARSETGTFSHSEVRLLTLLADQAAIAIINARLHDKVRQQALNDPLTGLPNRRALDAQLDNEIKRSSRSGSHFTVIMMDLDNFKVINDMHGHNIGDRVLQQITRYLKEALRTTDFLARYGGDELALILPDTGWPQAEVVINKVLEQVGGFPIDLPDGEVTYLSISAGLAIFPRHAVSAANLLRSADEALYRAKRRNRGSFEVARKETGQLPAIS